MDKGSDICFFEARFAKDDHRGTAFVPGGCEDLFTKGVGISAVAYNATTRGRNSVGGQSTLTLLRLLQDGERIFFFRLLVYG